MNASPNASLTPAPSGPGSTAPAVDPSADVPARSILSVRTLAVRFGERVGLPAVTFNLRAGERLALLGPSGAGKSSLLRTIAGLDADAGGSVFIDGRDVTREDASRRRVVYLHQAPLLFPHLSVLDNVAFPLEVRGVGRADARERASGLLRRVRLDALHARRVASLSGGQRHRVALARALAADPAVLLLDEPFAALDPALRADVREAVQGILDTRALAALLVTHDVDEAAAFADRMAVLLGGRIVQLATPETVLRRPATEAVARFLGIPNLVPGQCDGRGTFRCALGAGGTGAAPGAAWLVARPDALRCVRAIPGAATGTVVRCEERVGGTVWHVATEAAPLVCVAPGGAAFARGDAVTVTVLWDRAHVVPRPERPGSRV